MADALWLAWYPASYVVLVLLVRSRFASVRASLWLDGVIGALTVVALAFAVAYGPIVTRRAPGDLAAVLTNLAYPLGDLLLLGVVVAIFGAHGLAPRPRPGSCSALGLALNAAGRRASTSSRPPRAPTSRARCWTPAGRPRRCSWAWRPGSRPSAAPPPRSRACGWCWCPSPAAWSASRCSPTTTSTASTRPALALTAATLLLVLTRTALVFCENQRMISAQPRRGAHRPAHRPAQPPQPDGRPRGGAAGGHAESYPRALVLFDLDGFKEYNDAFGHPAGDGLLVRLGRAAGRRGARPRARLPARRRRVLRAARARRGRLGRRSWPPAWPRCTSTARASR